MDAVKLKKELSCACPALELLEQEPMARHTSFRIGGAVKLMARVKSEAEFAAALKIAAQNCDSDRRRAGHTGADR